MSTVKTLYGTDNQSITITLASGDGGGALANGHARQSNVIDNTSNLYLDALVFVVIQVGGSGVSITGQINIYAFGTVDQSAGSPHYTANAGGGDSIITLNSPNTLPLIGTIPMDNSAPNGVTYFKGPMSVAAAFGGVLPEKWGIVIENKTGTALGTTEANNYKAYQGIYAQVV